MESGPSVNYVNEVVLRGLSGRGIRITPECRITNDFGLSAAEIVTLLKSDKWSWPKAWYRQNRNYFQHFAGAAHLEKKVEERRWIHIIVSPALKETKDRFGRTRNIRDWTGQPREIELHAEKDWLRPSSYRHLGSFLLDRLTRSWRSQSNL